MRRVFPIKQADSCGYADTEDLGRRPPEHIEQHIKRIDEQRHAFLNSEKLKKPNSCDSSTVSGDENLNNINNNEAMVYRLPSHQKPPRASAYPIFTAGASHRHNGSHSNVPGNRKLDMEKQRAASFSSSLSGDFQPKLVKDTLMSKQKKDIDRPVSAPKNRPVAVTSAQPSSFRTRSLRHTQPLDGVTLLGGMGEGFSHAASDCPFGASPLHTRSFSQATSEGSYTESSEFSSCFTKATESSGSSTSKRSSVGGGKPGRGSSPFKYLSARMVAEKLVKVLGKERMKPQLDRPASCQLLQDTKGESSCALGKEQAVRPKKDTTKQELCSKQSFLGSPCSTNRNLSGLLAIEPPSVDNASIGSLRKGNHLKFDIDFENQHSLETRALASQELALSLAKENSVSEANYRSQCSEDYGAEATVCDLDKLKLEIRNLRKEKRDLALEVAQEIRARVSEQNVAVDQLRLMKMETEAKVSAIEKDKDSLQESLEKELDRRENEWTAKLDKVKVEERKLKERIKDLAEDKTELQQVVASFKEKEAAWRVESTYFQTLVSTLKQRLKATEVEMARQMQTSAGTLESMEASGNEAETLSQRTSYLEMENSELQKEMTRLRRVCNDQEMTIEGLWQELDEVVNGSFDCRGEGLLRLQRELLRLAGVEQGLRSEINAIHVELTRLKQDKNAAHAGTSADLVQINQELQVRVDKLQSKAVQMQEENKNLTLSLRTAVRARRDAERTLKVSYLKEVNQAGDYLAVSETYEGRKSFKNSILEENLKVLNSKLQLREADLEKLDEEMLEILNSRESLQMEVDDLHGKLLVANQQVRELEREVDKREAAMEVLRTDAERHSKDLTNLQNELSRIRRQRDDMQKEAEDMSREALRLTVELNESKKTAEKLEEEVMLKEGQISILRGTYTNCDCLS